jgi:hypothetical protein
LTVIHFRVDRDLYFLRSFLFFVVHKLHRGNQIDWVAQFSVTEVDGHFGNNGVC